MISRRKFLTFAGVGVTAAAFDLGTLTCPALLGVASADVAAPGRGLFGGTTTLDQTIVKDTPGTSSMKVTTAAGEQHRLRSDNLASYAYPSPIPWAACATCAHSTYAATASKRCPPPSAASARSPTST